MWAKAGIQTQKVTAKTSTSAQGTIDGTEFIGIPPLRSISRGAPLSAAYVDGQATIALTDLLRRADAKSPDSDYSRLASCRSMSISPKGSSPPSRS